MQGDSGEKVNIFGDEIISEFNFHGPVHRNNYSNMYPTS